MHIHKGRAKGWSATPGSPGYKSIPEHGRLEDDDDASTGDYGGPAGGAGAGGGGGGAALVAGEGVKPNLAGPQVALAPTDSMIERHKGQSGAERIAELQLLAEADEEELRDRGTLYVTRCDVCGTRNPFAEVKMVLAYRKCFVCARELCPVSDFKCVFPELPPRDWIQVVSAKYGHVAKPHEHVDVAERLRDRVRRTGGRRLEIGLNEDLKVMCGFGDPAPGIPKVLFLTVRIFDREYRSEWEEENNLMRVPLRIVGDEYRRGLGNTRDSAIKVLVASLGEPRRPTTAIDITALVQKRIDDTGSRILNIDSLEDLSESYEDPAPGQPKLLIVRYDLWNRNGELRVAVLPDPGGGRGFFLERPIFIEAMLTKPDLLLESVTFGHPANVSRAYDVTELVQARIDEAGGEWCALPSEEDIHEWLGDPYVGSSKALRFHYELRHKVGALAARERHGRLVEPIHIVAPVVAPLLHIKRASIRLDVPLGRWDFETRDVAAALRREVDDQGGALLTIGTEEDLVSVLDLRGRMPPWWEPDWEDEGGDSTVLGGGDGDGVGSATTLSRDEEALGEGVTRVRHDDDLDSVEGEGEGRDKLGRLRKHRSRRFGGKDKDKGKGKAARDSSASATTQTSEESGATMDSAAMRVLTKSLTNRELLRPDTVDTEVLKGVSVEEGVMTLGGRSFRRRKDGSWLEAEPGSSSSKGGVASGSTGVAAKAKQRGKQEEKTGYVKPQNHQITIVYEERGRQRYAKVMAYQEGGKIYLREKLVLEAARPFPHIVITGAAYGHPTDGGQRIDMKERLQRRVRWHPYGSRLDVPCDEDLDKAWGDPCPGVFKVLVLRYQLYAYKGHLEVEVPGPGTPLGSNVRLGWMPDQ